MGGLAVLLHMPVTDLSYYGEAVGWCCDTDCYIDDPVVTLLPKEMFGLALLALVLPVEWYRPWVSIGITKRIMELRTDEDHLRFLVHQPSILGQVLRIWKPLAKPPSTKQTATCTNG